MKHPGFTASQIRMKKNVKDALLHAIFTIFLMSVCLVIIDMYVPLKRFISGDSLSFSEILAYINVKQHIPIIIAITVALSFERTRKK
jgi:hypothetical protein